jgi:hypothetical protein
MLQSYDIYCLTIRTDDLDFVHQTQHLILSCSASGEAGGKEEVVFTRAGSREYPAQLPSAGYFKTHTSDRIHDQSQQDHGEKRRLWTNKPR